MKRLLAIFIAIGVFCGPAFSQKKEAYRVQTVVIDPGHGGAKPGAHGARSQEKDITLAIAKKFGKLIADNYPDVKVIYTRTTDVDISLAQRAHIANSNKADLFVSIHANSHPTSSPTGVETFVMGLSESKANLEVAKKENADILLEADYKTNAAYSGFDPNSPESYVMLTMFQHAFLDKSLNFAQAIQSQYKQHLKTINRGVKQAELYVLYKTTCPSVLTEVGFISNPTEEAFMLSEEGQAKIAICLFNAFMNFKASEEGTKVIANPVIKITGYSQSEAKPQVATPVVAKVEVSIPTEEPPAQKVETAEMVVVREPIPPATMPAILPIEEHEVVKVEELTPMPEPLPQATAKPLPSSLLGPKGTADQVVAELKVDTLAVAMLQEPIEEPISAPVETAVEEPTTTVQSIVEPIQATLPLPTNTATSEERFYTVQFLTSPKQYHEGDAALDGVVQFETYRKGDAYCYITGHFATFAEAQQYAATLQAATRFKDAWAMLRKVTPSASEPQATQSPVATDRISYRVQFCTSPRLLKAGDSELAGVKDFHYSESNGNYVYSAGDYSTQREAQARCNQMRKGRFKDAFVIAIYRDERITLEQARRITQSQSQK